MMKRPVLLSSIPKYAWYYLLNLSRISCFCISSNSMSENLLITKFMPFTSCDSFNSSSLLYLFSSSFSCLFACSNLSFWAYNFPTLSYTSLSFVERDCFFFLCIYSSGVILKSPSTTDKFYP